MIEAKEITITRAEGPHALCGKPRMFTGPACWQKASAWLRGQSHTFPATGGYDKHDLKIVFADGEVYEGRLDCKSSQCEDPDLDVAAHVYRFLAFMAGKWRPPHMTPEQYNAFLARQTDDPVGDSYGAFLTTHAIPERS